MTCAALLQKHIGGISRAPFFADLGGAMRATIFAILTFALCASVAVRAEESMDKIGKQDEPFLLTDIKADPSVDKPAHKSHFFPKIDLGNTILTADSFLVSKEGGIFVTGREELRSVGFNPAKRELTMGDAIISSTTNPEFLRDLGWVLLKHSDSKQAKIVLREIYGIDVDALAGGEGAENGESLLSHGARPLSPKRSSGRSRAARRPAIKQIASLILEPEAWEGFCGRPNKPCIYTNKQTGEVVVVTPEMKEKQGLEKLTPPKEMFLAKEFDSALLADRTKNALNERTKNLPASIQEFKLYVGAEWCPPCQGKKGLMLSNKMKIPTLVSWDLGMSRGQDSELLQWALARGKGIPALFTVRREEDGSVDWESIKESSFEELTPKP